MIKNIKFPSNDNYFGEIVDLNEKEKEIIKSQIKTDEPIKVVYRYEVAINVGKIYDNTTDNVIANSGTLYYNIYTTNKLDITNEYRFKESSTLFRMAGFNINIQGYKDVYLDLLTFSAFMGLKYYFYSIYDNATYKSIYIKKEDLISIEHIDEWTESL